MLQSCHFRLSIATALLLATCAAIGAPTRRQAARSASAPSGQTQRQIPNAQRPTPLPVSLANDVEPALTKLGCNRGACHGSQHGKGGFRLSLSGFDPAFDYETMVREAQGRRVAVAAPERSLLLLKPTLRIPHGGGMILTKGSAEYNLLLRWIKSGAPAPNEQERHLVSVSVTPAERVLPHSNLRQQIAVIARYSDGATRDVTAMARYASQNDAVAGVDGKGLVTTKKPGESAIMISYCGEVRVVRIMVPFPNPPVDFTRLRRANTIDELIYRKLARVRLSPSPRCSDAEFLRRVYLDTIATLPTPEETRAFLADADPEKRAKLIDRLLERPEYVDYRTLKLADLLRVNGQYCSDEGADVYYRWIHDRVQKNVGYDQFVRELITGRGSGFHVGPANYFKVATNPEELAEATAQSFLGVRIQCAKCHNHPFEKWKQKDYYGLAAFFARVGQKYGPEFGESQIFVQREGEETNPRTKQITAPKFLGGPQPTLAAEEDRRVALANWLTSHENRDFARVAVNRVWADYFGKGIVDAVDDFRVTNPPSNAPLLDALADDFIAHGYDIKYITRQILNSEAYGRSSAILPGNARDERNFTRYYPRRLPAETLLDAVAQVTDRPDRFWPYPQGWRAIQVRDSRISSYFLQIFGRPKREVLCACERSLQPNLAQSLHLINSDNLNNKLTDGKGRISQLLKQYEKTPPAQASSKMVEDLYLLTLCRYPTPAESKNVLAHIARTKDARKAYEDCLWALLNAEEFVYNH
jgi:hypothetical protein